MITAAIPWGPIGAIAIIVCFALLILCIVFAGRGAPKYTKDELRVIHAPFVLYQRVRYADRKAVIYAFPGSDTVILVLNKPLPDKSGAVLVPLHEVHHLNPQKPWIGKPH